MSVTYIVLNDSGVEFTRIARKWLKVSAIRERPVQRYSEVFGLGAEGQGFVVVVDFQLTFNILVKVEGCRHRFVVLSFIFQVWRYSPTAAISLLCTPSNACQSPSACMIARSSTYAYFLETVVVTSEVDVEEKRRQDIPVVRHSRCVVTCFFYRFVRTDPCGTPFLRRRNLLFRDDKNQGGLMNLWKRKTKIFRYLLSSLLRKDQTEKKFKIWQFLNRFHLLLITSKAVHYAFVNLVLCVARWEQKTVDVCFIWTSVGSWGKVLERVVHAMTLVSY